MKYNININQKAVFELNNSLDLDIKLDLIDCAIIDVLKDFATQKNCKKMFENDVVFYWFSWKLIVDQLPLSGLNTKQSVYKRFKKLEQYKVIERHKENQMSSMSFFKFGVNYCKLFFTPVNNDNIGLLSESLHPPINESLHNNTNNTNNKDKDNISLKEKEFNPAKEHKEKLIKEKKSEVSFDNPKSLSTFVRDNFRDRVKESPQTRDVSNTILLEILEDFSAVHGFGYKWKDKNELWKHFYNFMRKKITSQYKEIVKPIEKKMVI